MQQQSRFIILGVVVFGLTLVTFAQDANLSGRWTGTLRRGEQTRVTTMILHEAGTGTTGTLGDPGGQTMQIRNWKHNGNEISFDVSAQEHGHSKNIHFVGQVLVGSIQVHGVYGEQNGPTFVLHRDQN